MSSQSEVPSHFVLSDGSATKKAQSVQKREAIAV